MTTTTEMPVADILDKAADHIERVGWIQKYAFDPERRDQGVPPRKCRACALGAIEVASGTGLSCWRSTEALRAYIGGATIPEWNDAPGRTQDEVVAALRAAAEAARQ